MLRVQQKNLHTTTTIGLLTKLPKVISLISDFMATLNTTSTNDTNLYAALAYILGFVTGIIFLLISKEKYVRFHALQSIFLSLAFLALNIALGLVPFLGPMLVPFVGLGSLALTVVLMIKAYQGEKFKLPVIGDLAESKS